MLQTGTTASAARQDRKRCEGAKLSGCHRTSRLRTARAWRGFLREAHSGEAGAETERNQRGQGGEPMAELCLRRFVRLARCGSGDLRIILQVHIPVNSLAITLANPVTLIEITLAPQSIRNPLQPFQGPDRQADISPLTYSWL